MNMPIRNEGYVDWGIYNQSFQQVPLNDEQSGKCLLLGIRLSYMRVSSPNIFVVRTDDDRLPLIRLFKLSKETSAMPALFNTVDEALDAIHNPGFEWSR